MTAQSKPESIPWRQRDVVNIPLTAEMLGCSRAKVYKMGHEGTLDLVMIGGRTLVKVAGLIKLIDEAPAWTPRRYAEKALAARKEHSRRRLASLTR